MGQTSSSDALYGPRRTASERFPSATNPDELWNQIVAAYRPQIMWRKFFDEDGEELIEGHAMDPRNIRSARRKYELRVLIEGYDSDGRGSFRQKIVGSSDASFRFTNTEGERYANIGVRSTTHWKKNALGDL